VRIGDFHKAVFGSNADARIRQFTLIFAVFGFLVHLFLWFLYSTLAVKFPSSAVHLLSTPLSALYTPFSILLGYEVYEIIKAIPESFSTAVGKQYEVATLLVVRDVFKRLSAVEFSGGWAISGELGLVLLECSAFLVLFYTSLEYQQSGSKLKSNSLPKISLARFVAGKKIVALILMTMFVLITILSFASWLLLTLDGQVLAGRSIFFSDFFTCLILADIFILLISYSLSHDFYSLVRNTGFVLSTVLLWVAIAAPGASGIILFIVSALIGITILKISKRYNNH
jgi:hypothetical protein